uniref:Si:dkey-121a11.3 n=1 Tax=Lepisosteus oculatus TaxID=7918 RepID=W5MV21_LEPOC
PWKRSPAPRSSSIPACHTDQAPGSAVSALQSKVKALSERRAAGKEDKGPSAHEQGQQRKGPSKAPTGQQVASKPIGSDEEVDPQFQVHTYLTDNILQSDQEDLYEDPYKMGPLSSLALSRGLGEGASLENLSNGVGVQEEPNTKSWTPPKGFWKAARPETLLLRDNLQAGSEQALRADTQHQLWEAPIQRKATPGAQPLRRDLQRSDSLESHLWRAGRKELPLGGLWRADSWESVCSNSSSLSLAERVEMNRGILKQMLNRPESRSQSPLELRGKELPECNGRGLSTLNDSDWDSGISLQDSEHSHSGRAFVSCEELPLSPRHEQAKRLLERARMKARSHPLKADHSILPIQKEAPKVLNWQGHEESSGAGLLRRGLAGRDGATASCGNLSDSSSGESSGGLRRRHGQSPTRVRFEDESAQDAEVRYLERLQQRRRAAERGQGLLVSKPHLSSYVNGGPSKSEGSSGRAERGRSPEGAPLWSRKTRRTHDGSHSNSESGSDKGQSAGRKCDSCGSVLQELDQSLLPNSRTPQQAPCRAQQELAVKMIPCWVSPSNHRVRTECIKETYIGEVSPVEDRDFRTGNGTCGPHGQAVQIQDVKGSVLKERSEAMQTIRTGEPCPTFTKGNEPATDAKGGLSYSDRTVAHAKGQQRPLVQENSRPRPSGAENGSPGLKNSTLPPNPYTAEPDYPPDSKPKKSALKNGSKNHPSGQRIVKVLPSVQYRLIHLPEDHNSDFSQTAESQGHSATPEDERIKQPPANSSLPATLICGSCADTQVEEREKERDLGTVETGQAPPESTVSTAHLEPLSSGDSRHRGLLRAEYPRDSAEKYPESSEMKDDRPKLSLRRFLSAIGHSTVGRLSKGRSSSMEQLSVSPRHSAGSPSSSQKPCGQLKKAPSLQSLRLGSPFTQLRKASSVQSLQSPKRKADRSSAYMVGEPASFSPTHRGLQRALSVEDVGCPSGVRTVGRVAQAFPDGTLLLELSRPANGPFGFLISRGKGRPDSGVYVEEMGDSGTQKLYAGLLGVGDEILEVNGEKVAGLSLEEVTWLMTQHTTTSIRVLRHRRSPQ